MACGGACDGKGACAWAPPTTSCGASTCAAGQLTTKSCDGSGGCSTDSTSCDHYTCNAAGTACLTFCAADAQCAGGRFCIANKCLSWVNKTSPVQNPLSSIWGAAADDIWAVGEAGTIIHYDGAGWSKVTSGTTAGLHWVWGSGKSDVWAVGTNGVVLRYKGSAWSSSTQGSSPHNCVWGTGPSNVWVSGAAVHHFDGTNWSTDTSALGHSIWGSSASDVYLVGIATGSVVYHYDGSAWSGGTNISSKYIARLFGFASNDIWAVGEPGILRYNGSTWAPMVPAPGTTDPIGVIWGSSPTDVWVGAAEVAGPMFHFDGSQWKATSAGPRNAIWGSSATDVWTVGAGIQHLE
jgi:hypothetical protein